MDSLTLDARHCRLLRAIGRTGLGMSVGIALLLATALAAEAPAPIAPQLQTILKSLSQQLNRADAIVEQLRETAKKGPEQTKQDIASTSKTLGDLADRLRDDGEIMAQLHALKNAAQVHQARVQTMHGISEQARSEVLSRWTSVLQQIDTTEGAIRTMRGKLLSLLEELRRVQVDVSELMLVGSYEDAVKALNDWLKDLTESVTRMRATIRSIAPPAPSA
jgi:chromosome segregation ATPase